LAERAEAASACVCDEHVDVLGLFADGREQAVEV
jgi:hypothetical protein